MSVRQAIEFFVEVYNRPGSDIYPLFGDEVEWQEFPFGRSGGRDVLFKALREARNDFQDLHLEVISIVAGEREGVLESEWTAVRAADGAPIRLRVLWVMEFAGGKIVRERDYSVALPSSAASA